MSLIDAGGNWPGLLEMRIARQGGEYSMVDGPLSKAKKVVGGYLLFEMPDREAAIAFSRRFAGDGTCYVCEIVPGPADVP